jgi:hypothetical protein
MREYYKLLPFPQQEGTPENWLTFKDHLIKEVENQTIG